MALYALVVRTLALLAVASVAAGALLLVAAATRSGRSRLRDTLGGNERHVLAWAWTVALAATAGSLWLSDAVGFVPCLLCWYQRVVMYPLVIVLGVALLRADRGAWRYALPFPVVGLAISLFHVWLQWRPGPPPEICGAGPPCSGRYLSIFGFVTIPTMAGAAFLLIGALMVALAALEGRPRNTTQREAEPEPSAVA